jgi:hypothetical protein
MHHLLTLYTQYATATEQCNTYLHRIQGLCLTVHHYRYTRIITLSFCLHHETEGNCVCVSTVVLVVARVSTIRVL